MIPFGANVPEADELNASAVAVALTLFVFRDQMRAKNVGRPARMTCTCTCGFTPEGIPSSKIAICHGGPVVQEIHIHTSRRRIAYDVLICQRLGYLCSRRAGSGPKASRVLRISRHSAEGEHPRGPEGGRIGGSLRLLPCQIKCDDINRESGGTIPSRSGVSRWLFRIS
jgi:hypothetical protein